MTISLKELTARGGKSRLVQLLGGVKKKSKYGSVRTWVGDIQFASKKEANRYCELRLLETGGRIKDLKLQEVFELVVNGVRICAYKADFSYTEIDRKGERRVVEDTKGKRTREYLIKRNLMRACFGIIVRES